MAAESAAAAVWGCGLWLVEEGSRAAVDIAQWRSDQKKMARPRSEAATHHQDKSSGHRQYKCDYIGGSASLVEPRFLIVTEALAIASGQAYQGDFSVSRNSRTAIRQAEPHSRPIAHIAH